MAPSKSKDPEQPPARRNRTERVARGAASLTADAFARAGFHDPTLVLRWAEIAGPEVARLCQPIKLSDGPGGGVLMLKVEPGAAVFLQHQTRMLGERINTFLGRPAVARLRLIQGPLPPRPPPQRSAPAPRPIAENDPARSFAGPEPLREALLTLARRRASTTAGD